MIDPYVILTPVLLLAVIALLRFVGCDKLFGIDTIKVSPPGAPTLGVPQVVNTQVTLSWNSITGATSYNVKSATTPGGPYPTPYLAKVQAPATSYTDTPPAGDFFNYYVVSTQNDAGESGNSNEVFASLNLVGLFLMNEGSGPDMNLVDGQPANFAGPSLPMWAPDPSINFNGGGPQNSYLDAGPDAIFDGLTTGPMTVVAKVNRNPTAAAAGICEKNDEINSDSGFLFGWDSNGALALTVQRGGSNLRVAGGVVPGNQWVRVAFTWDPGSFNAHLYLSDLDTTQPTSLGNGTIGSGGAVGHPFRIGTAGNLAHYAGEAMTGSLNGKIAYLAIYKGSRPLTLAEIQQVDAFKPVP